MIINANKLRENSPMIRSIKYFVKEILSDVNQKIKDADFNHQTHIRYEIQTVFDVPNMTIPQAQTHIFGEIFDQLQDAGYDLSNFVYNKKECYIYISWSQNNENMEYNRKKKLIASLRRRD